MSRDGLIQKLAEKGIDSRPFFYPIHVMPPYQGYGKFPVAEELGRKGISLPSGVGLTHDDATVVCEVVVGAGSD
jgi:perosamine synthetase